MYSATGVEPTKLTAPTCGSVSSTSTASRSPLTMLNTPSGRPACFSSSATRIGQLGSFSDGLSTNVLPHAMATGYIHMGTIDGKLNGVMPAHTPTGWRADQLSTAVPTFSLNSPFSSCGMPQANSTTSMPRITSPRASDSTLPCSAVIRPASSSRCCSSSALNRNITRARCSGGVAAQAGSALAAAAIAARVSSALAYATMPRSAPVAGLCMVPVRPEVPATNCPPTKWPRLNGGRPAGAVSGWLMSRFRGWRSRRGRHSRRFHCRATGDGGRAPRPRRAGCGPSGLW